MDHRSGAERINADETDSNGWQVIEHRQSMKKTKAINRNPNKVTAPKATRTSRSNSTPVAYTKPQK
jgi:hypothetical protein